MSKGLEALEDIKDGLENNHVIRPSWVETVEKELEALAIIKKKDVWISWITELDDNCESYNFYRNFENHLTQEEYDKIKEWLNE